MPRDLEILTYGELKTSEKSYGALPFERHLPYRLVTETVKDETIRKSIAEICESLHPNAIDPGNRLGLEEVELALVISGNAGVKLLGEVGSSAQASVRLRLKRKTE